MAIAIMASRMQILTRLINRTELQLTQLTESQRTLSTITSETERAYNKAYYYATGTIGALTDEEKEKYSNMMEQIETLLGQVSGKDTDIEVQIKTLNTKLQQYRSEKESVEKSESSAIKDEAPKLTVGG